jgi:hypothetical protein
LNKDNQVPECHPMLLFFLMTFNSQIFKILKMSKLHLCFSSFLSGSRNGRISYGYSSIKGKRSSMEDFFETKISEVDGQMVAFFGVFDGMS